ncbi:hypothetical protein C8J57DRAFT_1223930 [Mycena rebaudengoi]|nr:hypothetical protein C8J57DRAFT_1223930 [Mycena rebaudengoi]
MAFPQYFSFRQKSSSQAWACLLKVFGNSCNVLQVFFVCRQGVTEQKVLDINYQKPPVRTPELARPSLPVGNHLERAEPPANSEGDQIRHQRYIKRACAESRLQLALNYLGPRDSGKGRMGFWGKQEARREGGCACSWRCLRPSEGGFTS